MIEKDNLKKWMDELGREEIPANFTINVVNKIKVAQSTQTVYSPILSKKGKILILSVISLVLILAIVLPSSGQISGRLDPWFALLSLVTNTTSTLIPSLPEGYNTSLPQWDFNPIYGYGLLTLTMYLIFMSKGMGRRLES